MGTCIKWIARFWKFQQYKEKHDDDSESLKTVPFARCYTVFNVDQCDELDLDKLKGFEPAKPIPPDSVIDWARSTGAMIHHGGSRAYYQRATDSIQLPHPSQFRTKGGYQGTALHELTHWTGHESRLERSYGKRFGDQAYAFEELVAELGSSFLCAMIGVPYELEQHASYLESWLTVLKENKRAIFTAASHAQKAADFIIENVGEDSLPVAA